VIYIKNRYLSNPRLALLGQAYYSLNAALVVNINIVIVLTIYILYVGVGIGYIRSKNELHMGARMGHIWEQEWAIHGSMNGPYMGARMGYIWKHEWAIHGSKNRPFISIGIGYIWPIAGPIHSLHTVLLITTSIYGPFLLPYMAYSYSRK